MAKALSRREQRYQQAQTQARRRAWIGIGGVLAAGAIPHNVGIKGGAIGTDLNPGLTGTIKLGELASGTYQLYCDISDHEERGMVATFTVIEPPAPTE